MNNTRAIMALIFPELGRVLKLITTTIIFSIFLVAGVVISVVEGAYTYDEVGYISFTPLLICGLVLSWLSALILGYVFLTKNWTISIPVNPTQYPTQRPAEQYGYGPVDHQL